mmetsp:Transcript_64375/g.75490  ORF Transcript_64375/g.75490 Transcript_64375/m.75490 type:complete len:463 (-) Transcript_64375:96-1484(-)
MYSIRFMPMARRATQLTVSRRGIPKARNGVLYPRIVSWNTMGSHSRCSSSVPTITVTKGDPNAIPPPKKNTEATETEAPAEPMKRRETPEQQIESLIMQIQFSIRDLHHAGQFTEALEATVVLIEKCESHFGVNHPVTASSYNNAAVMHKNLGDYDLSRECYRKALDVYGVIVGKDHANYAMALNNLGNLDRAQSSSLELNAEDGQGASDANMTIWNNKIQLLQSAVEHLTEALSIRMNELGDDHPHTVLSMTNLGGAISSQAQMELDSGDAISKRLDPLAGKRWGVAEQHLRTALRIALLNQEKAKTSKLVRDMEVNSREEVNVPQMPPPAPKITEEDVKYVHVDNLKIESLTSASSAQNLAVFLKCRADVLKQMPENERVDTLMDVDDYYNEAEYLYRGALKLREEELGEHHPDTVASKFSLAELMISIGNEEEGERLRKEIVDSFGEEEDEEEEGSNKI